MTQRPESTLDDAGGFCPQGCYWPCEHRASAERARLVDVDDYTARSKPFRAIEAEYVHGSPSAEPAGLLSGGAAQRWESDGSAERWAKAFNARGISAWAHPLRGTVELNGGLEVALEYLEDVGLDAAVSLWEQRVSRSAGTLWGIPLYVDDDLPPDVVELRSRDDRARRQRRSP